MKTDFNKRIEEMIDKLSRDYLVDKEILEDHFSGYIDEIFVDLQCAMRGVRLCAKNKNYLKELKKLNHKYSFYH